MSWTRGSGPESHRGLGGQPDAGLPASCSSCCCAYALGRAPGMAVGHAPREGRWDFFWGVASGEHPPILVHGLGRRWWLSGYRFSCGSGSLARCRGALAQRGYLALLFCFGAAWESWGALQGHCACSLCVGRWGVSSYQFSCGPGSHARFQKVPGARQPRPFGAPVCQLPVLGTVPSFVG